LRSLPSPQSVDGLVDALRDLIAAATDLTLGQRADAAAIIAVECSMNADDEERDGN
jgi:hypothetical protein